MAIVFISSMFQGGREELAQALARKTNWPVLCREEMLDLARKQGIKIGRLEVSIIKTAVLSDRLAREKELYLAFLTSILCEKAKQGNFIYHGRAGHLLLPGVSHKLRVGLTAPQEMRIKQTARSLNLTPEKAESYLAQLDEDTEKWIHFIHRVNSRDPGQFDVSFNLENIGLSNIAGMLCAMAELPDYQPNPSSKKLLDDLYLSSKAKIRLSMDERTSEANLQVQANSGMLTVTYPPHQAEIHTHIPQVLSDLDGCREIQCTMAETNILWVQERFEPESENFNQITHLAQRWGAAVELMRLIPSDDPQADNTPFKSEKINITTHETSAGTYTGGVEDDEPENITDDGGLRRSQEELIDLGRFSGQHTVYGSYHKILERAQANGNYALVVIGNMFLSKGHSAQARQTRELALNIRDRLKAPVITVDELKSRFLFGKKQAFTLMGYMILVGVIYHYIFTHQEPILEFLSGPIHQRIKWLAPLVILLFVPFLAYIYGKVAELALKIINID